MSIGRISPVPSVSINVAEENAPPPLSLFNPVQTVQQTTESPRSFYCSSNARDASITSGLIGIATGSATSLALTRLAFGSVAITIGSSIASLSGAGLTGLVLWGLNYYSSSNSHQQETDTQPHDPSVARVEIPTEITHPLPSYEELPVLDFSSLQLFPPPSYDEAMKASVEEQDMPPPYGEEYSTSFNN